MKVFPGWWQVAAALVLQAASSASVFTAYSVIAVPLQEEFQPSRMLLMMGITVAALAAGTLGTPIGAAIDRYSVRLLMLVGAFLLGSGFMLLSLVESMSQVIWVYLLPLALGCTLTGPVASSALLARWFTRRRGLAMSLAASGAAVGGLLIPPLLQFLIEHYEWRQALRIYAVAIWVITLPLVGLLVINRPADRNLNPDGGAAGSGSARAIAAESHSIGTFLRDRNFWLLAVVLGGLLAGPMGLVSNLLPLVMDKGIVASDGALLISILAAAGFAGKLVSGIVADRVSHRLMLAAIALAVAGGSLGYVYGASFQSLALYSVILGFMQGGVVPLWGLILAKEYGPDSMGRSMGLMGFLIMPFTLVAAPLFGWVYDTMGSYDPILEAYVLFLLGVLVIIALLRPEPRSTLSRAL
ncbi:MFS transporter [Haliea sp. E17]|uniref:MFS transporter n=1 Tax=Haliea sp. E17 TaxID=3401576 RepID=UPI003AAB0EAD